RPVNDEWMLIEAARQPRVVTSWTYDRKSLRDAAASLKPYFGSSDLSAAKELASQLLAGKERPCTVIVSDGAAGQVDKLVQADSSVVYWPIGQTDDNLGITRLSVRVSREQATHYAYVSVVNSSTKRIESQVVFEVDGSATAVEPMTIEPS